VYKQHVCRYFLKAALNFVFPFLSIVTPGGKLLKIFYASIECTVLLTKLFGIWCLKTMLIPHINIVYLFEKFPLIDNEAR